MFSRFISLLLLGSALPAIAAEHPVLRICADPNNLPFSNRQEQGFENRIASLLASDLGATLRYNWSAERRSVVKNTLDADRCDAILGVPAGLGGVSLTEPYYTSAYVFVTPRNSPVTVTSLNDAQLAKLRIGVHVVSGDYTSPANALARRGLAANLHGYSLFGPAGEANPPARLIDAVAHKEIDLAIVWGPFAGFFGPRETQPLEIRPVMPPADMGIPFTYSMAIAVKQGNEALRERLDLALRRSCPIITKILDEYGIPRPSLRSGGTACEPLQVSPSAALR